MSSESLGMSADHCVEKPAGQGAQGPGADPRDVREPWAQPDVDSLTPDTMMAYIRARCPWALAHTHRSLAPYLLEETVELMAAIVEDEAPTAVASDTTGTADPSDTTGTADAVEAELADVLYQVVFHAALIDDRHAREPGATWHALQNRMVDKYVRRHPHVFNSSHPVALEDVQRRYQEVKTAEKCRPGAVREPSTATHLEAADDALRILSDIQGTMADRNRQG